MSYHVQAAHPSHYHWLTYRVGALVTPAFRAIECVDSRGHVRAMVGFDSWTENSVQCHVAADTPSAWRALVACEASPAFRYPFEEAGRGLILAVIRSNNPQSLALTRKLGFKETYRIKDGGDVGVDLVMFEMRRDECRWLKRATRKAA